MQTNKCSTFIKESQPFNHKSEWLYVFAVDSCSSMLFQASMLGQWSRAEAATQLISRQIFNLDRAEEKYQKHFLIIGYNALTAIAIPLTPERISAGLAALGALSDYLLSELRKLGGAQHTNRGLCQIKKIHDDWIIKGKLPKHMQLDKLSNCPTASDRKIRLLLYTDADDAIDRDLQNPFAELKSDPLVGIFIGSDKSQAGWIALRQVLSKCSHHGEKQLFTLDGFTSFSKLESIPFLSFDKNLSGALCPSCLQAREKKIFTHKEGLDLVLSEPIKSSTQKGSDDRIIKRISAELFVTAGPRKDDDIALGEDAAGVIVEQNMAWFWVADGTSESPVVLDYSSRSLAMQLGSHFADELTKIPANQVTNSIEQNSKMFLDLLQNAFDALLDSWTNSLNNILESENSKKIIDSAFELDAETNAATSITHREFIDFSTTFLGGVVTNHGTGVAACIGDCPLCVDGADGLNVYPLSNDRIFVRLRKTRGGYKFDRNPISEDITLQRFSNATIVMAGSDGIGELPEFIKAQMKSFRWPEIRKRIHRFISKRHDDKTFCVIHIG